MRQHAQKAAAVLLFCAAFFFAGLTNAETLETKVLLSFEDLYFYKEDIKVPLFLAPKIIVRFYSAKTDEERTLFLSQLQVIGYEEAPALGGNTLVLSFLPTATPDDLVRSIKEIAQGGEADAAPVFILDGREVVVDGIILEPATAISIPFMKESLTRLFGGISFHQFTARGKSWHVTFADIFFLNGGKDPLHALSFANLLETSKDIPWVAHARPEFRFLKEPIVAKILVTPATGTIGEKRTVMLTISVFDPDISIEEDLIVDFGAGDFLPKNAGSPPPSSFFKILGTKKKEQFGATVVFTWLFTLYVPEKEWMIAAQKIPYTKKGADPGHVETSPTTFFLLPHISSGAPINDMPSAENLPLSVVEREKEKRKGIGNDEPPPHWLDALVLQRGSAEKLKKEITIFFGPAVVLFLLLGAFFIAYARFSLPKETASAPAVDEKEIARLCAEAETLRGKDSYDKFARIVAGMLHAVWPRFPREEFSLETAKQAAESGEENMPAVFKKESGKMWLLLAKLDASLAKRYASDSGFARNENDTKALSQDIALLAAMLVADTETATKQKEA